MKRFYKHGLPYAGLGELPGKLIVIEGADGVGRSTQIELLTRWLEVKGYGVVNTGWTQSTLLGPAIEQVKSGNTLHPTTFSILYAADFADRLENQILPALKSGFIVLADRYMYTAFARHIVRGADAAWLQEVYGFAVVPNLTIYLKVDLEELILRTFETGRILNYWESGMDIGFSGDLYESFVTYQSKILTEFDKMTDRFGFSVVDASGDIRAVNLKLRRQIDKFLSTLK